MMNQKTNNFNIVFELIRIYNFYINQNISCSKWTAFIFGEKIIL